MNQFPTIAGREMGAGRSRAHRIAAAGLAVTLCAALAHAAGSRQEARLEIAPGGTLTIVNAGGSVTLHSTAGRQVVVAYTTHSDKVEVDQITTENKQRLELRTHALPGQKPTADEAKVDYDVTVPPGVSVNVSTVSAAITADGLSGDLSLSSQTRHTPVPNVPNSHLHLPTINPPPS